MFCYLRLSIFLSVLWRWNWEAWGHTMKGLTGYSHLEPSFASDETLFLTGLGKSRDHTGMSWAVSCDARRVGTTSFWKDKIKDNQLLEGQGLGTIWIRALNTTSRLLPISHLFLFLWMGLHPFSLLTGFLHMVETWPLTALELLSFHSQGITGT